MELTISWGNSGLGKIKSPTVTDTICLRDVFQSDFIQEMHKLGVVFEDAKIILKMEKEE